MTYRVRDASGVTLSEHAEFSAPDGAYRALGLSVHGYDVVNAAGVVLATRGRIARENDDERPIYFRLDERRRGRRAVA